MAVLYRTTGKYSDAIERAREGLQVLSAEYPAGSRYHLSCETNLAEALNGAGRAAEAEAAARKALEIGERVAGPDDIRLSHPLHVLGNVLHASGRSQEAAPPLARALALKKEKLGPEHPLVATTLATYSAVLFRTGDLSGAEATGSEAVRILEAAHGGDHVYLVGALNNLAQIRAANGSGDAEPLYRRALTISEHRLGPKHPDHAKVQANFAAYYLSIGRLRSAETMYRAAAATLRAGGGESHPAYRLVQEGLADVYARMGRVAQSESLRRDSRSARPVPQIPAGFAADRTADAPQ
jgi:tetratricopeptide (TPR) repeat protein